jgi:hypothetical protein
LRSKIQNQKIYIGGVDMPRGDGTGPMGSGPTTGRGAVYCAGFGVPGYTNPIGMRYGIDRSRRMWRMFCGFMPAVPYPHYGLHPAYTALYATEKDEKEMLSRQAEFLEKELKEIKQRLSELKNDEE